MWRAQQVLIVFEPILSRKATRYFEADKIERANILAELDACGAKYFIGNDKTEHSVMMAYNDALNFLAQNPLFTYVQDDSEVKKYEEVFVKKSKESSKTSDKQNPKEHNVQEPELFV